jgi:hypothetical protein
MEGKEQAGQTKEDRMNIHLSLRAAEQPAAAPLPVQKAFIKQLSFLARNLNHPSLRAKKFDEATNSSPQITLRPL